MPFGKNDLRGKPPIGKRPRGLDVFFFRDAPIKPINQDESDPVSGLALNEVVRQGQKCVSGDSVWVCFSQAVNSQVGHLFR